MKKHILLLFILGIVISNSFAQEEEKDQPVTNPFESGVLIDAQTTVIPDARTLEFIIQHKFGSMDNGTSDLWGIYAPGANVRLALNYIPVKNLQIGIGQTKKNMYTDFNAKWTIFKQTEKNTIPVSVALYGSAAIDGRDVNTLETGQVVSSKGETQPKSIKFDDRLSYYSQLIIGRKFNDWLSIQAGASFTHYNMSGWDYNHDIIGAHLNGRIKFSPQGSLIFTYDHPLKIKDISEQWTWDTHPKPNLAFGVEIFTFTHAFQIYVGTADGIIPQDIMMYNQKDWKDKGLAIGFTITRLWMF
ncbi:DUF5777 family beta-barrel protein [Maribellus maritimus]|uniref:DUF5777 family beta-barrel protein n=1 Tax=Maribellus maritimus TaxID=2870838 RepID=UPI001EEADC5D|nr:DUF5777 family beta-barrel protein [Maribellus maritimus]MCG6189255.1 DUF5777 family beta-barrel protein [Maribellus maritimus]